MHFDKIDFPAADGAADRRDWFAIMDSDGMAKAALRAPMRSRPTGLDTDHMNFAAAVAAMRDGYQQGVVESDTYLKKFEDMDFASRRWRTVDAVAGGAPNVGAYLAGSPVAMRRRERQVTEGSPLTIFCDMVSSQGIDATTLKKRGATVLAMARMLGALRPVTVYGVGGACCTDKEHNPKKESTFALVRLDTPLDLSRAAFILAHPAAGRLLLYTILYAEVAPFQGDQGYGSWAYKSDSIYRSKALSIYSAAASTDPQDCIYLPAPHLQDAMLQNPEKWLRDMLARYGSALTDA